MLIAAIECACSVFSAAFDIGPAPAAAQLAEDVSSGAPIVVTAPATGRRVLPPSVALEGEALIERQPRAVADALRGLPGVSVRTNSRGEAMPRVRGSEERQTAVFLDGAPLVVPWDGRIDLGLIPAGLIARVEARKGAVPIEYGANAVAGAIDLLSRSGSQGPRFLGVAQAGTFGIVDISGVANAGFGGTDVTLAASHQSQDAARVADLGALPFSQADSRRRTNTQSSADSLFGALGGQLGAVELRAGVLHFGVRRGIAPESDRDPAVFAPRYWRYPRIDFTQATISAETRLAADATLRLVGWRQWFGQTIEGYRNMDFAELRNREVDLDRTTGGRLTLSHQTGPVRLRWSAMAQSSIHVQVDTVFPPATPGPRLRYRQSLLSLGGEVDLPIGDVTDLTAGIGYDRSANPLTGDKPTQRAAGAPAFSAGLRHRFGEQWTLTVSSGRRTRFPSARELFGEALGRFLPNSDLRPERAWLADAELTFRTAHLTATINPFLIRSLDGIGQRIVTVGDRQLRQRFNLAGTTSLGVDWLLQVSRGSWSGELSGTILDARADRGQAPFRRLVQRPRYEAVAAVDWAPERAFDLRAELHLIGSAVDLGPDGGKARLPASSELNLRLSVPAFRNASGLRLAFTAAIDNLADTLILPQLGLPRPGRTVRLGFRIW